MTKLNHLVQQVRTGTLELNAQTARNIMKEVSKDHHIDRKSELEVLQDLAAEAPKGSVFGRELLQEFVQGAENRFRSTDFHREVSPFGLMWSNMRIFNPFLSAFEVPKASYARTDAGNPGNYSKTLQDQTEINATRNVIGQEALEKLAMQYKGAAEDVGLTRTHIVIKDDVYQVYRDKVEDKPVNERDPLGAVQAYLDAHYTHR